MLCNFSVQMLKYFYKNSKMFFLPTKSWKNHLKNLHTYGSWEFFFSAATTAQNSPELHFRFINSYIQLSLLRSLLVAPYCFLLFFANIYGSSLQKVQKFQRNLAIYIGRYQNSINNITWVSTGPLLYSSCYQATKCIILSNFNFPFAK